MSTSITDIHQTFDQRLTSISEFFSSIANAKNKNEQQEACKKVSEYFRSSLYLLKGLDKSRSKTCFDELMSIVDKFGVNGTINFNMYRKFRGDLINHFENYKELKDTFGDIKKIFTGKGSSDPSLSEDKRYAKIKKFEKYVTYSYTNILNADKYAERLVEDYKNNEDPIAALYDMIGVKIEEKVLSRTEFRSYEKKLLKSVDTEKEDESHLGQEKKGEISGPETPGGIVEAPDDQSKQSLKPAGDDDKDDKLATPKPNDQLNNSQDNDTNLEKKIDIEDIKQYFATLNTYDTINVFASIISEKNENMDYGEDVDDEKICDLNVKCKNYVLLHISYQKHSSADFHPSIFLGLVLILYTAFQYRFLCETVEKLVRFGKYSRISPLWFSTLPFCHGACGSAK